MSIERNYIGKHGEYIVAQPIWFLIFVFPKLQTCLSLRKPFMRANMAIVACIVVLIEAICATDMYSQQEKHDPVKISIAHGERKKNGTEVIFATFAIDKGWYLYANPVENSKLEKTQTKVTVTGGELDHFRVIYPPGKTFNDGLDDSWRYYEGEVRVQIEFRRGKRGNSPIEIGIFYFPHTDRICGYPLTKRIPIR